MKAIFTPVCCLCIMFLVSACNKFDDTIREGLSKLFNSVSINDSVSIVNSVRLKYRGVQNLRVEFTDSKLSLDVGAGDIILSGSTARDADLKVSFLEFSKGDATIFADKSTLKIKTKSGKPALITRVEGNIPNQLKLALETESGDITVSNLQKNPSVTLMCSSGDITLSSSTCSSVITQVASGDISISQCNITVLDSEAASGDISVSDSSINTMRGETASGDINLRNSRIEKQDFSTASGSVNKE